MIIGLKVYTACLSSSVDKEKTEPFAHFVLSINTIFLSTMIKFFLNEKMFLKIQIVSGYTYK